MAGIGDLVYLTSVLTNTHVYGVVTDPDNPDMFTATFEIHGENGVLVTNALVGDKGADGQHAFALRLQKSVINNPADLPDNLTDTETDIGKYWMIEDLDAEDRVTGTHAYIWFGTEYRRMMMGSQGPPGPVPVIQPDVTLVPESKGSSVDVSGDVYRPSMMFNLAVPPGPQGPATNIGQAPDVSIPPGGPLIGQVLGYKGNDTAGGAPLWEPLSVGDIIPRPYTIPQSAFQPFEGITTRATIGTFPIPANPFDWKPLVWGHLKVTGLNTALLIGVEVRIGNPTTGALVAMGYGNGTGWVSIMPHTSTPTNPNDALTPDNDWGKVPANHTDATAGTLYVNLYNHGAAGVYQFNPDYAALYVSVNPV